MIKIDAITILFIIIDLFIILNIFLKLSLINSIDKKKEKMRENIVKFLLWDNYKVVENERIFENEKKLLILDSWEYEIIEKTTNK